MSLLEKFERYPLTFGPTPIEHLPRLTAALAGKVEIYAKRDDCNSGLAMGGNKLRKLEYIVPDAIASGADTLVSIGGVQSNHTRMVAATAAKIGMKCVVEDARAKGAEVLTGGEWVGNCCQPTILSGVDESMVVCREETFGPVTSVYPVADLDEAIRRSNDTNYGLSAAIYTQDLNKAFRYMQEVKAGMVHVNAPMIADEPHVPFGGVGYSGFGREGTDIDVDTLTEWKWVTFPSGTAG